MNISPDYGKVRRIAATGKYDVMPVSCEILSDFTTPIETVRILKKASKHCFMLESAQANETWGRYTFLGFEPRMEVTCIDGVISSVSNSGEITESNGNPSDYRQTVDCH